MKTIEFSRGYFQRLCTSLLSAAKWVSTFRGQLLYMIKSKGKVVFLSADHEGVWGMEV
jgi:hypothetical protein